MKLIVDVADFHHNCSTSEQSSAPFFSHDPPRCILIRPKDIRVQYLRFFRKPPGNETLRRIGARRGQGM